MVIMKNSTGTAVLLVPCERYLWYNAWVLVVNSIGWSHYGCCDTMGLSRGRPSFLDWFRVAPRLRCSSPAPYTSSLMRHCHIAICTSCDSAKVTLAQCRCLRDLHREGTIKGHRLGGASSTYMVVTA